MLPNGMLNGAVGKPFARYKGPIQNRQYYFLVDMRKLVPTHFFTRGTALLCAVCACAFAAVPGCATSYYKQKADEEVYSIIKEKSAAVAGMEERFSIDQDASADPLAALPTITEIDAALGDGIANEQGAAIVSLEEAVNLSVRRNRTYQGNKEAVYLKALSLTLDRHLFAPIFDAKASANYNRSSRDVVVPSNFTDAVTAARDAVDELEAISGTPAELISQYLDVVESAGHVAGLDEPELVVVDERSVTGQASAGVALLLKGGGRLAASITSNFLRFITGSPRDAASSVLDASFTQPLLRGAGADVVTENLTQGERDVLYALRDFTHYRKTFAVEICGAYYNVLRQRDAVRNGWFGLTNSRKSVEREQAFAAEGLSTQASLGRMKQFVLDNENRYNAAVRSYQNSLDQFKISLGLSTDALLVLNDKDLDALREKGIIHPEISSEDAIQVAVVSRLDYQNDLAVADDAARKVKVAENFLKPRLDLVAGARVQSQDKNQFEQFDFQRMTWNAGLDVDPIFDRKSLRNAYRSTLISYEAALRQRTLAEDQLKLQVRDAWRNLDQARRAYDVAVESVRLSERRVEEQNLLAELGQATAQDQVDAQNDLITSQNSLTSALVGHTIARLGFWRDMGLLYINDDGRWKELDYGNKPPSPAAGQ